MTVPGQGLEIIRAFPGNSLFQRSGEATARPDAELPVHAAEVHLHSFGRDEQLRGDLFVRHAGRRKLSDPALGRGQPIAVGDRHVQPFQFDPSAPRPQRRAQPVECLERSTQGRLGRLLTTPAPLQLAEQQLGARQLERHWQSLMVAYRFVRGILGGVEIAPGRQHMTPAAGTRRQHPGPIMLSPVGLQGGDERVGLIETPERGQRLDGVG